MIHNFIGLICVLAVSVVPMVGCSSDDGGDGGTAGSGGGGGTGGDGADYVAGPPVTVSGPSPLADCQQEVPEGWANAETEPWIALNPTDPNNMVGIWMQDRPPRRALVTGVTFDGGTSWEEVVLPGLTLCAGGEFPFAADPWLTFAANGDLYAAALSIEGGLPPREQPSAIVVSKSGDGGRSWGEPTRVGRVEPPMFEDKESITAHPTDECTIYLTWTRFTSALVGDLLFSRTTDCGETWEEPKILYSSNPAGLASQIVVLPDGTLVAIFKPFRTVLSGDALYAKRSTDGGATWSEEAIPLPEFGAWAPMAPDSSEGAERGFHDVAVDRESGAIYAVWTQLFVEGVSPVQVALTSSTDGGLTWSAPIRVDQTPSSDREALEQAFLGAVEVSDEGTIGVTYYNFQNDVADDARDDADVWFTYCNPSSADCDDEAAWGGAIRLTSESFDIGKAPIAANVLFPGDYVGLTSFGSDFFAFFSATTDDDPGNAIFVPIRPE